MIISALSNLCLVFGFENIPSYDTIDTSSYVGAAEEFRDERRLGQGTSDNIVRKPKVEASQASRKDGLDSTRL